MGQCGRGRFYCLHTNQTVLGLAMTCWKLVWKGSFGGWALPGWALKGCVLDCWVLACWALEDWILDCWALSSGMAVLLNSCCSRGLVMATSCKGTLNGLGPVDTRPFTY